MRPENTLEAFQVAVHECGAEMLEFDVHLSRDHVPVVIHDHTLQRTTNGIGFVGQKNYSELLKLDAGYHFDPDHKHHFPYRGKNLRIPSLEAVLNTFPTIPLAIEIKQNSKTLALAITQLLQKKGRLSDVIVGSKYDLVTQMIAREAPEMHRFCSRKEIAKLLIEKHAAKSPQTQNPSAVASTPCGFFGARFADKTWIQFLHQKGMKAFFWTVNQPDQIQKLVELGADGIITDHPLKTGQVILSATRK